MLQTLRRFSITVYHEKSSSSFENLPFSSLFSMVRKLLFSLPLYPVYRRIIQPFCSRLRPLLFRGMSRLFARPVLLFSQRPHLYWRTRPPPLCLTVPPMCPVAVFFPPVLIKKTNFKVFWSEEINLNHISNIIF